MIVPSITVPAQFLSARKHVYGRYKGTWTLFTVLRVMNMAVRVQEPATLKTRRIVENKDRTNLRLVQRITMTDIQRVRIESEKERCSLGGVIFGVEGKFLTAITPGTDLQRLFLMYAHQCTHQVVTAVCDSLFLTWEQGLLLPTDVYRNERDAKGLV